jgi:hypothetical protein
MDKWSIATRVFTGAWVVLGLLLVFKVVAALSGVYTPNWDSELRFWAHVLVPSAAFLAVRTSRSAPRER